MHTTHYYVRRTGLTAPELANLHHAGLARLDTPDAAPVQLSPIPVSETARGTNAGRVEEQEINGSLNSASTAADRKEFERLRALLAFRRHCVYRADSADGPVCFVVTRGSWLKEVADLAALHTFAQQIGGAA